MVIPSSSVQLDPDALLARVLQLEPLLKLSEARCARAEYKLQDLLRRIHGPVCFTTHTLPNVLPSYMLRQV